jgi:thiol:disulfide interchange protein DsbD
MAPQLDAVLSQQPVLGLAAMFGAGLVTSLAPCVYPMIPIVAGVLGGSGAAERSRRRTIGYTLTYILGLALVYASLGLLAGLTGSLFGGVSSNRWAYFTVGNLLLLFALAMLDVIPVNVPNRVLAWARRFGGGSYAGVFAMGATSGLVAAPCGAPAFAAALTFVTVTGSAVWGFAYLFVFSLGMTAMLAAVGLMAGLGGALPRSGPWTQWIKRGAGVVLLGMAEYYFIQMGKVS